MAKKETLIGARARTATTVADLRGISLWDNQYCHTIPGRLIFDELCQLVVRHRRDDAVHPLASGSLPDALQVSQHDGRAGFFCLVHYLPGNLVADSIDFSLFAIPYFLNYTEKFSFAKPLSQPGIVSPNSPDFLTQKFGVDTITATDGGQVSLPKVYSKEMGRIDSRLIHFLFNNQVNKPSALSFNELSLSQRANIRNITVGLKGQPDTTPYAKTGELEPIWGNIGILSLQTNNVPAQDQRVVPMLGALNLLKESLRLLPSSRIEVCPLPMNNTLEALVFLFQNIPLPACRVDDFSFDCLLDKHLLFALCFNIFSDSLRTHITSSGSKIGTCPHTGHFSKMWKLLTQYPRSITFKTKGYLMNSQIWHSIHKKMDMVRVYLQSYHLYAKLGSFFSKKLIKPIFNFIHQYLPPPPGNPDEMIVDQRDRVSTMSIILSHKHILAYFKEGGKGQFIPQLKHGGFLALIL